jgi:ribosomal protein S18 acetylase RimI-like enzyme
MFPTKRKGWGRRLIGAVIDDLDRLGLPGVWVGLDPRNSEARTFYLRLGFESIAGAPETSLGLRVENWKKVHGDDPE